ncbi:hypothetical protein CCHL11_07658 [Colletotrichum chlorophyti]|uniref:Uncharacterized protein n=1 Tax=Colletotrichum chlorophyti TaxID=708187 RepID=A0A1Q8RDB8_9PEZI|nr:hypothetical protein CCHL11_07658 [Colletotrichum chlorophyti]
MADYFCCPSDTTCMVLASNTTALCCPRGSSCDTISPIICDMAAQDVVENPSSPIHTTNLDESLPSCGGRCCPFGYVCQDDSACVLDQEAQTPSRTVSDVTKTTSAPTQMATADGRPAVSTPTTQETSTPSSTAPAETEPPAASPGNSKTNGIIAGTTVAAVASVAGLTCLLWLKRRSISEKVGCARFPRPWQQLRGQQQPDGPLPRYASPPPAYTMEMKQPPLNQYAFKHYSPESVGNTVPVELPATPVSFSTWIVRNEGEPRRPRTHYEPYRRP